MIERRSGVALALAFVAGFVDVTGWITLDRLYTSHLTGNTSWIAIELAKGHGGRAFTHAVPVLAFAVGVGAITWLAEILSRRGVRSAMAPGLLIEAVLLGAFLLWARLRMPAEALALGRPWALRVSAAILGGAMGVQTATFRCVDGATIRTTYVTGMITHFAEELTERLAARRDAAGDAGFARRLATVGGIWPAFLAGALSAAFGHVQWGVDALVIPLAMLAALAGLDVARPVGGPIGPAAERRALRRGGRD